MRAAETHRHAEALRGTDGDIGTELARRAQQGEGEQIGGDDRQGAGGMGGGEERGEVVDAAGRVGVLDENAKDVSGEFKGAVIAPHDLDAKRLGAGADNVDRLRVTFVRDKETRSRVAVAEFHPMAHHHGLGGCGALVEHGRVGNLQAGQVGDEGLEIQQCLEPALGDLGLVGGVGGVPAGVLEDVALDDAGDGGVVIAHADVAAENLVLRGDGVELGQGLGFASGGGQAQRTLQADLGRDGGVRQRVD